MSDNVIECEHCSCAQGDSSCCDCGVNPAMESLQREYDLLRNVHENVKSHFTRRTEHLTEVNQTLRNEVELRGVTLGSFQRQLVELRTGMQEYLASKDISLLDDGEEDLYELLYLKRPYSD